MDVDRSSVRGRADKRVDGRPFLMLRRAPWSAHGQHTTCSNARTNLADGEEGAVVLEGAEGEVKRPAKGGRGTRRSLINGRRQIRNRLPIRTYDAKHPPAGPRHGVDALTTSRDTKPGYCAGRAHVLECLVFLAHVHHVVLQYRSTKVRWQSTRFRFRLAPRTCDAHPCTMGRTCGEPKNAALPKGVRVVGRMESRKMPPPIVILLRLLVFFRTS